MHRPEIDRLMLPKTSAANNSSDVQAHADAQGPLILARLGDLNAVTPLLMNYERCMMTAPLERSISRTIEKETSAQADRDANTRV